MFFWTVCLIIGIALGRIERELPLPRASFSLNSNLPPNRTNANKPNIYAKRPSGSSPVGINYRIGSPVMTGPLNIYHIYYGDWNNAAATWNPNGTGKALIEDFAQNIGNSAWYKVNQLYYYQASSTSTKTYVSKTVAYKGSVVDSYSQGASLSDAQIRQIVLDHIKDFNGGVADPNGLYFVLTSPDVTATSGFCTKYCGWHSYTTVANNFVKFSFNGVPPPGCNCFGQTAGSPNQLISIDSMLSVYAHELVEKVSDPLLNAWYDSTGYENADKCAVRLSS